MPNEVRLKSLCEPYSNRIEKANRKIRRKSFPKSSLKSLNFNFLPPKYVSTSRNIRKTRIKNREMGRKKGGRVIDDPNNGIFQYAGSFMVWEVGGEPLVIYSRTTPKPYVGILYCSERQANELKEERIVKFPKTKKPQKL